MPFGHISSFIKDIFFYFYSMLYTISRKWYEGNGVITAMLFSY